MREPALARGGTRVSGVIDTLSAGFGVVNRHLWIVLIPILLDLFLWGGPQLSAARLVSRTLSQTVPIGPGGAPTGLDQDQQRTLVEMAEGFNLLSALAPSVVGVPSLMAIVGIRDPLRSTPIDSWGTAALIFVAAVLGGMLLGSLYFALLAQEVRDGALSLARLLGQALRSWARVLLYLLVLAGLSLLFGVPLGFLTALATLASPVLGSLVLWAVTMAVVWAGLYLFFVPEAIFVGQVGPLRAIRHSVAVVRLNFGAAVGLAALIFLISLGMGQVWVVAARQLVEPWGLGLGILGNAYIATGLIAASMLFYRERIEKVRVVRTEL